MVCASSEGQGGREWGLRVRKSTTLCGARDVRVLGGSEKDEWLVVDFFARAEKASAGSQRKGKQRKQDTHKLIGLASFALLLPCMVFALPFLWLGIKTRFSAPVNPPKIKHAHKFESSIQLPTHVE
jgi:hypothetical protein